MLAALALAHVLNLRADVTRDEEQRLLAQLRLVEQSLSRQLLALDQGLRSVVRDRPRWTHDGHWESASPRLRALDVSIAGTRSMLMLDEQGQVVASSRAELLGLDASARDYFRIPRDDNDPDTLYISPPFRTVLGSWSLNLSRVVHGPDGRFAGVVAATLDPDWLREFLEVVNFATDMWSAAAHSGGRLLVMVPHPPGVPEDVELAQPGSMFLRHRDSGQAETLLRGKVRLTGEARLMAHRTLALRDTPTEGTLVLALTRDLARIDAGWHREAGFVVLLFALLLGLSAAGLALMQRSERRALAAEVASRREIEALEQRWLMALQGSGLDVWDWNPAQDRFDFSPQWRALVGLDDEQFGRTRGEWQARLHPDDLPAAKQAMDEHLAGRRPGYEAEYRIRVADGSYRWLLTRGRVVERDADGRPRRVVGTATDSTARHEAEAMRAERDRAEAASRAKSEFLSRMSHELRTPLNAVLGFAQLLSARLGTQEPDEQRRYIAHIEKAGWHLLAMINDVLDLSRIESGQLDLRIEPVALAPALDDVLGMIGPLARARALTVQAAPPPAGARVQADALRLRQILTNLLSNAVKYNVEGGRIDVTVQAAAGRWRVAVADTGPGIPAEGLAHLFEPFNRLGFSHSAVEGAGIGLTLTRWLVQEMGGTLSVRSVVGQGSCFEFELPAAAAAVEAA